jgi:hypothetical protein
MSCTPRNRNDNKGIPNNQEVPSVVTLKPIPFNVIEADLRDSFSIQLQVDPLDAAVRFSMECEGVNCDRAVSLDADGILSWNGPLLMQSMATRIPLHIKLSEHGASYQLNIEADNYLYQAGEAWSPHDATDMFPEFAKIVALDSNADGRRGATVFYLGQFAGESLVATAAHVFEGQKFGGSPRCDDQRIFRFETLQLEVYCKRLVWKSAKYDFALLAIDSKDQESLNTLRESAICPLPQVANPVNHRIAIGGYGRYRNPYSALHFMADDDCRVLSEEKFNFSKSRTSSDEIQQQTSYPVISCDGSPGDSGAPLLDRDSGKLLGLVLGSNGYLKDRVSSSAIQAFLANPSTSSRDVGNAVYLSLRDVFNELQEQQAEPDSVLKTFLDEFYQRETAKSCKIL